MKKTVLKYDIDSRDDFYLLYLLIENCVSDVNIEINLGLKFMWPMDVLILTKFIIWQRERNCEILVHSELEIYEYLQAIGLVDFVSKNTKVSSIVEAIPSITAMPIRRVARESMGIYINATQTYMRTICPTKDLEMLDLCLAELINNVYDHSKSPIGAYVFCQYYPSISTIKVAVSDLGIGIPRSVNEFLRRQGKSELTKRKCVGWAIKENKTTQSLPRNLGKGLDNVNSFVRANNSSWTIFTDNIMMSGFPSGNKYQDNPIYNFQGTIVALNIKIDNLNEQETVESSLDW